MVLPDHPAIPTLPSRPRRDQQRQACVSCSLSKRVWPGARRGRLEVAGDKAKPLAYPVTEYDDDVDAEFLVAVFAAARRWR